MFLRAAAAAAAAAAADVPFSSGHLGGLPAAAHPFLQRGSGTVTRGGASRRSGLNPSLLFSSLKS